MSDSSSKTVDMAVTRKNARHDMITGIVLLAFAVFMFVASFDIPLDDEEALGPQFFPQSICILLGLISSIFIAQGLKGKSAPGDNSQFELSDFIRVVIPLAILAGAYLWLLVLFGFLIATTLALYIAFLLFNVKGIKLLIFPPIIAVVFYLAFFVLLGIFEPPAQIFSLSQLWAS